MSIFDAVRQRTVVLVTPDTELRERISAQLLGMRWTVLQAAGGAEAMEHLSAGVPEAMIVDHWLPDLNAIEFNQHAVAMCPGTDLLQINGSSDHAGGRSSRRNELLHALREAQNLDDVAEAYARVPTTQKDDSPVLNGQQQALPSFGLTDSPQKEGVSVSADEANDCDAAELPCAPSSSAPGSFPVKYDVSPKPLDIKMHLPEMVGGSSAMSELARMVRMVAPHAATVLIQGETGTGKELVAKAVHRLSVRASKAFVVLNCAAIPEHLLEAELFGHTRGAFTGAVTSRVGRIEAAHGGTLFLDEIGEMPLPLQAKMLRFLESGEIQRVGDNDSSLVDVRIVAATHQPLEANASDKLFRLDLYHRLAVFPVEVPALRDRREDIPMLVEFFLRKCAQTAPRKSVTQEVLARLTDAPWDGNVRELCHVVQRAVIMAGDAPTITMEHLRMRNHSRDVRATTSQ